MFEVNLKSGVELTFELIRRLDIASDFLADWFGFTTKFPGNHVKSLIRGGFRALRFVLDLRECGLRIVPAARHVPCLRVVLGLRGSQSDY